MRKRGCLSFFSLQSLFYLLGRAGPKTYLVLGSLKRPRQLSYERTPYAAQLTIVASRVLCPARHMYIHAVHPRYIRGLFCKSCSSVGSSRCKAACQPSCARGAKACTRRNQR
ncbi:hypothetical protein GGI35DRAFT_158695 [Trichoderma velutinum]